MEARAELLERRLFTSITLNSPVPGWTAYWMLHSPTSPRALRTLKLVSLSLA